MCQTIASPLVLLRFASLISLLTLCCAWHRVDGQQNYEGRRDLEHHQEIARLIKEEDFLREPLKYFVLNEEGGW